jgi:hypothetical protein
VSGICYTSTANSAPFAKINRKNSNKLGLDSMSSASSTAGGAGGAIRSASGGSDGDVNATGSGEHSQMLPGLMDSIDEFHHASGPVCSLCL